MSNSGSNLFIPPECPVVPNIRTYGSLKMKCVYVVLLVASSAVLPMATPAIAAETHKAIAICMGLNAVSPSHYSGWSGDLRACEFDAEDMAGIAESNGFDATKLLTS